MNSPVAFITGASSGIGAALAHEFSRQGYRTVLVARRTERIEDLARDLSARGTSSLAIAGDVTRDGDLEAAVAKTLATFGQIDVVVANAGFGVLGKVERLKLEDFHRQFATNVDGVLRTVWATVPALKVSRGRLLIIGSVMGYLSMPESSPYGMSKFAVRALAESLEHELAPAGVQVKYIAPGFVQTEIYQVNNKGQHKPSTRDSVPAWIRMPADQATRQIVARMKWRRREIVITGHGQLIVFLARHFPGVIRFAIRNLVKRHRLPAE